MNKPMTKQELLSYIEKTWDAAQREAWGERFCDKNCTWLDHHPECDKAEQPVQQEPVATIRALTDQCAALIQERDELQKQVWRYEKNGVTCQTYQHKIDRTCSECNVQENYTSPQTSKPPTQDMVKSCPYYSETLRGAFFDGWIKAEAAHGIKEKNNGHC